jgi:adenosylcobinamide-GDP ribazoletransferase
MANMALEILKSSLSFLTTIPAGGDIENLRRNLWVIPFVGLFMGLLISFPSFFGFWFLCLVLYVIIEGINHIDGLADFGDALFAPKEKKIAAMKDVNVGAGGVTILCLYFITLYYSIQRVGPMDIVMSQIFAKFSMLLLLTTSKPAWDGLGAYMMQFAGKKDLVIGSIPLFLSFLKPFTLIPLALSTAITFLIRKYSEKNFGGINGDVIGACNCMTFATTLLICSLETDISLFVLIH